MARVEGAGYLLLLAAAHEMGLKDALEAALPEDLPAENCRRHHRDHDCRRALMLTLLFLPAVGLRRTWDLREYTGDALALLTGRERAYGYRHTECFLSALSRAGGADRLTDMLAQWTSKLWQPGSRVVGNQPPAYYVDGHRKAVHSERLIPRGLVSRYGKVLGCRALMLLHDEHGHPLLATTQRGDTHLTFGLPQLVERYEQLSARHAAQRLVVDREGMASEFLAGLAREGRDIVTVPPGSASRIDLLWAAEAGHSGVAMKRVPIITPDAPRHSTAAIPGPSTIPPAARTGLPPDTATTSGNRLNRGTWPWCPPASVPCATSTSIPTAWARTASLIVVT